MSSNQSQNDDKNDPDSVTVKKAKVDAESKAVTTLADKLPPLSESKEFSPPPNGSNGVDVPPPPPLGPTGVEKQGADPNSISAANTMSNHLMNAAGNSSNSVKMKESSRAGFEPGSVDNKAKEDNDPDTAFNMSQSERKRFREKQRRQNISGMSFNYDL